MPENRVLKYCVTVLLVFQFIFTGTFSNITYAEYELSEPTFSEAFIDYVENGGQTGGYIPSAITVKKSTVKTKGLLYSGEPLPASYDPEYQSSVKNQYVSGPCWAFSALSSLEAYLIKNGQPEYNFSERNMMNNHGYDFTYSDGGNREFAVSYLARWGGPVYETDDYEYSPPPPDFEYEDENDDFYPPLADTIGYDRDKVRKHVQDVIYIVDKDYEGIKRAVMEYGSVSTSICFDDASFNSTYDSHYYNGSDDSNHGITIVGWDDSFSKTKFKTPPAYDGAFICKNSWGIGWGDSGYFYVSYEDKQIGTNNYAFSLVEEKDNYDKIYQYDQLGLIAMNGFNIEGVDPTSAWFANVFTASESDFENLSAISFYTTSENASYEIHTDSYFDGENIDNEELTFQKSGTLANAGYHTIKLNTPINLTANEKFIVAVKLTTPGNTNPIPLEIYYSGYASNATANAGESYIKPVGNYDWYDYSSDGETNVCLKAFTDITPAQLDIQSSECSVDEGVGNGNMQITVTRSQNTQTAVTIDYSTASGTAVQGVDFTESCGTLSFAENETSKIVTIPIINDRIKESDEVFTLALENPSEDTLVGTGTAEITVQDNDGAFTDITAESTELLLGEQNITSQGEFAQIVGSVSSTLTANVNIENHIEQPLNVTLVLALYQTQNGRDILKKIAFSSQDEAILFLNSAQSKEYSASFDVDVADTSSYKIKVMFWNTLIGCKPYLESILY